MGRVVNVIVGYDNKIRSAMVRRGDGVEAHYSISHLYPLELSITHPVKESGAGVDEDVENLSTVQLTLDDDGQPTFQSNELPDLEMDFEGFDVDDASEASIANRRLQNQISSSPKVTETSKSHQTQRSADSTLSPSHSQDNSIPRFTRPPQRSAALKCKQFFKTLSD